MSPRGIPNNPKTPKAAEVIEQQPLADSPDGQEEVEFPSEEEAGEAFAQATEEFNNHVKALVQNFVQQEIAALDERLTDLETLKSNADGLRFFAPEQPVEDFLSHAPHEEVPAYVQEHQSGDGTPWYSG